MKPAKNIEKLIKNIEVDTNAKTDEAVLNNVLEAFENSKKKELDVARPSIWRIIMKSRITKLTTVAVIIIMVGFGLTTLLDHAAPPAYAIEQTVEANRAIRYLHFKMFNASHDEDALNILLSLFEGRYSSSS